MTVLMIASSVDRMVRLGATVKAQGERFQTRTDCIEIYGIVRRTVGAATERRPYNDFRDDARLLRLNGSSTPDLSDMALSVDAVCRNCRRTFAIASPETSASNTPLNPSRTTSPQ